MTKRLVSEHLGVCSECSRKRREHWMLGEPEGDWTQDQTIMFYCAVILGVVVLMGSLWYWESRIDDRTHRTEDTLSWMKYFQEERKEYAAASKTTRSLRDAVRGR